MRSPYGLNQRMGEPSRPSHPRFCHLGGRGQRHARRQREGVLEISFGFILTVIPFLVLIPGAWALAVWASRERDAQSKLVEKLTTREKDLARTGEATSEPGPPTKEKAPQRLRG